MSDDPSTFFAQKAGGENARASKANPMMGSRRFMPRAETVRLAATLAVVVIGSFACGARRLPEYPVSSTSAYRSHMTRAGLHMAVKPVLDEDELSEHFGMDLPAVGILPILVVIENRNGSSSFLVERTGFGLESASGAMGTEASAEDHAYSPSGIALAPFVAPWIAGGMRANASEIQRNFEAKKLTAVTVSPGRQKSGFVYFQVPEDYSGPPEWTLSVSPKVLGTQESLEFEFPFSWGGR